MSKIHNLTRLSVRLELELSWFSEEYGPKIYFKYIYIYVCVYRITQYPTYVIIYVYLRLWDT